MCFERLTSTLSAASTVYDSGFGVQLLPFVQAFLQLRLTERETHPAQYKLVPLWLVSHIIIT